MIMLPRRKLALILLSCLAVLTLALAACTPAPASSPEAEHTEEHVEEGEHAEDEHGEEDHEHGDRLPNEGAVVRIVSPADGETIAGGEVVVEIETENFVLGEDGQHWHVYLDGESSGMVGGGDTEYVLRAVEPGEHTIEVYLGLGTHEELEDGASVTITVTE
jgi:hypothetical protein